MRELRLGIDNRRWLLRTTVAEIRPRALRVTAVLRREDAENGVVFADTLNLSSNHQRLRYAERASTKLGLEEWVLVDDLGLLLRILRAQRANEARAREARASRLGDAEREAALELLRDPRLLDRVGADFDRCDLVGEKPNRLLAYLAALSRLLDETLIVVIRGRRGSGKHTLLSRVINFVPEEERGIYYLWSEEPPSRLEERSVQHQLMAFRNVWGEDGEMMNPTLKRLLRGERLRFKVTQTPPFPGPRAHQRLRVDGPLTIFLVPGNIPIEKKVEERCLILHIDESREQTERVFRQARYSRTAEGFLQKEDHSDVCELQRNAQQLLQRLAVDNPYAREFDSPEPAMRIRRILVEACALLHQYQRPIKTRREGTKTIRYVEVHRDDITTVDRLICQGLDNAFAEIEERTQELLDRLVQRVHRRAAEQGIAWWQVGFTRREVLRETGWGRTQVYVHLQRLERRRFLLVRGERKNGKRLTYQLICESRAEEKLAARAEFDAAVRASEERTAELIREKEQRRESADRQEPLE